MNVLWPEARPVDMPNMDLKVDRPGDLEHIFFLLGFHPKMMVNNGDLVGLNMFLFAKSTVFNHTWDD